MVRGSGAGWRVGWRLLLKASLSLPPPTALAGSIQGAHIHKADTGLPGSHLWATACAGVGGMGVPFTPRHFPWKKGELWVGVFS